MDFDRPILLLREAIVQRDGSRIHNALIEMGTIAMMIGLYPERAFSEMLEVLGTDGAHKSQSCWLIWTHFGENWNLLSEKSKDRLLTVAEEYFDRSDDWKWSFAIGVLLAECYSDDRALAALSRLRQVERDSARAILPDAIRKLSCRTSDERLRRLARRELSFLERDPSPVVRREAAAAANQWK
jgi:hypothetical protein